MMSKNIPPNFLFPTNFRNRRNVKRLIKEFYIQGYGIAVYMIELLAETEGHKYPLEDIDLIADELKVSIPTIKTIIESYGLFKIIEENGYQFISPTLNEWLEPYYKQVEQRKLAGQISANNRKIKHNKQLIELSQTDSIERSLNGRSTIKEVSKEVSKKNKKQKLQNYIDKKDEAEKFEKLNQQMINHQIREDKEKKRLEELNQANKENIIYE